MLKIEKEYKEKYGNVPIDDRERISYLLKGRHLNRCNRFVDDEIRRISKIKWKRISFTIYLIPKPTPRPRLGRSGVFYVKGAADNKKYFKKFIEGKDIPLISTPTKFYCVSYLPIPTSMNIVDRLCAELGFIYPLSEPDWDNLAKAYCDMTQDTLLVNDSIIVDGCSKKRYSCKPRIEITLEYMEEFDSPYNMKKMKRKEGS